MLINSDCLTYLKGMDKETIDMVYLDPPFFTQKIQTLTTYDGREHAYSDIWESREEYNYFIRERLIEIRKAIKNTGSIFFHCDSSSSHYIRLILDDIFGEKNFISEIIWTYKRWSNSKKSLLPAHQTIFFYSKSNQYKFNKIYNNYSFTTNLDQILQKRCRNSVNKSCYKIGNDGTYIASDEKRGVPLSDVWDIPFLNPKAKERTGYPTQKPIELLERIIEISTNCGDTILDPFCGSGTTLVAAQILNRNYIGIDINHDAISISKSRLDNPIKSESNLLKIGYESYNTKSEYELNILSQLDCDLVFRNRGIDAILKKYYLELPVFIKIQKDFESLNDSIRLLINATKNKKFSFLILIQTKDDLLDKIITLPENLIIIKKYSLEVKSRLEIILKSEIAV